MLSKVPEFEYNASSPAHGPLIALGQSELREFEHPVYLKLLSRVTSYLSRAMSGDTGNL